MTRHTADPTLPVQAPGVRIILVLILLSVFVGRHAVRADLTNLTHTRTIGAGSGHLRYPEAQATLELRPGDTLYIRPGVYSGLSLGNLSGSAEAPITVVCDSNTVFTTHDPQPNEFTNIAHVRFENFRFVDYSSTCLHISGQSHDLLFKNFFITNASGYCFHIYDPAKVFDGTRASAFYNFKWENVVVDGKVNGAAISRSDWQPVSNLKSVLLDFEIYRSTFRNFDNTKLAFPVIGLDKCFNLQVHVNAPSATSVWPSRPSATTSASAAQAISRSSTASPANGPTTCGSGP